MNDYEMAEDSLLAASLEVQGIGGVDPDIEALIEQAVDALNAAATLAGERA